LALLPILYDSGQDETSDFAGYNFLFYLMTLSGYFNGYNEPKKAWSFKNDSKAVVMMTNDMNSISFSLLQIQIIF